MSEIMTADQFISIFSETSLNDKLKGGCFHRIGISSNFKITLYINPEYYPEYYFVVINPSFDYVMNFLNSLNKKK